MNRTHAGLIVGRMNAHFPSIAANDLAAQDWVDVVALLDYDQGQEVANLLIAGWSKDRTPRIADWQETARQVSRRHRELGKDNRFLEAGVDPDRVHALIAEARAKLTVGKDASRDDKGEAVAR